ncbi:MAG: NYN domain-containing protein [Nitrospirae bacterium]|nr:NYN domain-containing protein [Nitrospirota bacterium]
MLGGKTISYIIIDGYNLIGIYHKDLKKQREQLIDSLIEYRKRKGHQVTVVFDGWKTGGGKESQSVISGIKVIYSRIGDKADSVIKRIISTERREWIVVTSDRDIADYAWATGSVPLSSEDFLNLFVRKGSFDLEREEYDEEYKEPRRRGNPRRLSRKERAILRALNKI